jgi:hypothetical protein
MNSGNRGDNNMAGSEERRYGDQCVDDRVHELDEAKEIVTVIRAVSGEARSWMRARISEQ